MSVTIGELAVLLGFKIDGVNDLDKVATRVDGMVGSATKLAAGVDLATTGLALMIHTALDAAVGFQKFGVATGLSSQELQQWNYRAVLANVSADEMMKTVESINQTRAKAFASGGANLQPWVILGIDPSQNPFTVLTQLSNELTGVDQKRRSLAREIAEQAGIGRDIFQMLLRPDPGKLGPRYIVNPQDQKNLEALNRQWQQMGYLTGQLKNKFSAELSPELTRFVIVAEKVVDLLSRAVDWLARRPNAANWIAGGVVTLSALASGVLALAGAMKFAAIAAGIFDAAFLPVIGTIMIATGGILGYIQAYKALQQILAPIPKQVGLAPGRFPQGAEGFRKNPAAPERREFGGAGGSWRPDFASYGVKDMLTDMRSLFARAAIPAARSGSITLNNEIHITEAGDANRTRQAVGAGIGGQLLAAGLSAQPGGQ